MTPGAGLPAAVGDARQVAEPSPGLRASGRLAALGALALAAAACIVLELVVGSVAIPFAQLVGVVTGEAPETVRRIVLDLRLPRALTAAAAGASLAVAGLVMQTLFRNPLAGPWVLGVVAGARLGVAVAVVAAGAGLGMIGGATSLAVAAVAGSMAVLGAVVALSRRVDTVTLLVLGLLLGFVADGLVSVVLHFTHQVQLKVFASWVDGSFARTTWSEVAVLVPVALAALLAAALLAKHLDALLLGEGHARSLGTPIEPVRRAVLGMTALAAGVVTAFCGPVVFLGIAVPHLARGLFQTSSHRLLVPATALTGAALALAADLVVHLPWDEHFLHLNAVNALVGAPVVAWVVLRAKGRGGLSL